MKQNSCQSTGKVQYYFSLSLLFIFLLHACNLTKSSPVPTDIADTYRLAKKGEDSLDMRQLVWQEADEFCQKKNQYFMPISKNYNQNFYEMVFRCLNAGDPELLEGETPFQKKRYNKKFGGYGEVQY